MEQAQTDKTLNRLQAGRLARSNKMAGLAAGVIPTTRLRHAPRVCNHPLEVKATTRRCTQVLLPLPLMVD
jgi:hypothetical protein